MSAQLAGILCGVFAVLMSIVIYWGGFAEEHRAEKEHASRVG